MVRTTCPVCGWRMRKGDVRSGSFSCPGCGIQLHVDTSRWWAVALVSGLMSFLIGELGGFSGLALLAVSAVVWFPLVYALAFLEAWLLPKSRLAVGPPTYHTSRSSDMGAGQETPTGEVLHLSESGRSPAKPAKPDNR
jgi:hypothetical protein